MVSAAGAVPAGHAESAEAKKSCLHLVPEFEQGPVGDLHLVHLLKDIRETPGG